MKVSNRKAQDRERWLSALESYANLGDTQDHWKRFRLKYPDFFPADLTCLLYTFAESLVRLQPGTLPFAVPPLLYYRDRLRDVWSHNDPAGENLRFLYGMETSTDTTITGGMRFVTRFGIPEPSGRTGVNSDGLHLGISEADTIQVLSALKSVGARVGGMSAWPTLITFADTEGISGVTGQPKGSNEENTRAGLPPGKPVVNGISGQITWEFGCAFQESIYELMQQRWRAMVCPECGKYFLADKSNQKFCSTKCFGEVKRKRALEHWRKKGSKNRQERMAKARK